MDLNHGAYTATVIDNCDSEGLARVLVRVPALRETSNGVWARLATLMAGEDSGTLFLPDVGDEVLVVFVQGDLRAPCVIGALWNKTAPPPAVADTPASVLQVRARNGVTLRITDDRDNNSLIVETPGGQRIALRDNPGTVQIEDGNGNAVSLSSTGVKVLAASKVEISAGVVDVDAGLLTVQAGLTRFEGVVRCDT